jgi:hypothetical protein
MITTTRVLVSPYILFTLALLTPVPAMAQYLNNLPATVVSTEEDTEVTGSVPAVTVMPSGHQPKFQEIGKMERSPALHATISGVLPSGTAIKSVELFAKPIGTTEWQPCTGQNYINPDNGYPITRYFCGPYKNVEFSIANGTFTCSDIATDDRYLRFAFFLEHDSIANGFDFRAIIHHLICSSEPGSFRKN